MHRPWAVWSSRKGACHECVVRRHSGPYCRCLSPRLDRARCRSASVQTDADLQRERLSDSENDRPSRWYLAGFLAPADDAAGMEAAEDEQPELVAVEEADIDVSEERRRGRRRRGWRPRSAGQPNHARRFLPSSIGLTVLLPLDVNEIEALVSWGDYRTEPPPPREHPFRRGRGQRARRKRQTGPAEAPEFRLGARAERAIRQDRHKGRPWRTDHVVPDSACEQRRGGGLQLETHARTFTYKRADGTDETVRAVTVFWSITRKSAHRYYADVAYVFQARLELIYERGFCARRDLSGVDAHGLRSPGR